MNIVHKVTVAAGLAATFALSALSATPAAAQAYHPLRHASRMDRRASHLDRRASRAFAHGHFRKGTRLSNHAANLDRHASRLDRRYARHHGL